MKQPRILTGFGASIGMLILILDGKTALIGAKTGVELCLWTIIPSLFPFFVLSVLLTGAFLGQEMKILRPLGRLFSMSKGSEALLIPAFLGGYPAGAQSLAQAYGAGLMDKQAAQRYLTFCSNAGPAFLFGMLGPMFPKTWMVWLLWGIHIFSAFLVSRITPGQEVSLSLPGGSPPSVSAAVLSGTKIMAQVCGWVVLFRVVLAFLERWLLWLIPREISIFLSGLLELSNGCCALSGIESIPLRFLLASVFLAWGGFCVAMQTASVVRGLSIRSYLRGKLLQTLFSLLLSLGFLGHPLALIPCIFPFFLKKTGNNSRNPAVAGV